MEKPGDSPQAINPDSASFLNRRNFLLKTIRGGSALFLSALVNPSTANAIHETSVEKCNPLKFDRSEFKDPLNINNPWFPLEPGTQYVMEGTSNRGDGVHHHKEVTTDTDLVKDIEGVKTRVVLVEDYNDGILVERELLFVAQDNSGNVVKFGQYPELFDGETFLGAPLTWIAGQDGAEVGVLVPGKPVQGLTFSQGFAPEVESDIDFLDCGGVASVDGEILIIHERSPFEDEVGIQRKFYKFGVGPILVDAIDDPEAETLKLVRVSKLTSKDMDDLWLVGVRLDHRAYGNSRVYRQTLPIEPRAPRPVEIFRPVSITPPKSGDAGLATVEN